MKKIVNFIVSLIAICIVLSIFIDFCRFPECYISTWKYQLQNDIAAGNEQAITYYNENYIENGRALFE